MQRRFHNHTEAISDDVTGVEHPTMPRIGRIELFRGRYIKKQVPKRCLESVQREVEQIERHDSKANCCVFDLYSAFVLERTRRVAT